MRLFDIVMKQSCRQFYIILGGKVNYIRYQVVGVSNGIVIGVDECVSTAVHLD